MRDASAQELLLLSALQECRLRLDAARAGEEARAALRSDLDAARAEAVALAAELAEERERGEALRIVLDALAASVGVFGLRRRAFRARIAEAGRQTPASGPQAARHAVLLAEARRLGGITPEREA